METSSIIFLVTSCTISFAFGRIFVHFRDKKREKEKALSYERQAQALRDRPIGPESKNKSKRKRQMQQLEQPVKKR